MPDLPTRRLIINADDLGVNPQRSHGIFQCAEFGVVTSASLLPNGSDSDAAARHARERKVPCGLHLNLTDEYPLSKAADIETLLHTNGTFTGSKKLTEALKAGTIDAVHLGREIRAQFDWFLDSYGMPTHVSGHDHVHIEQAVIAHLVPLMEQYGVAFVRIPAEQPLPPFGYDVPDDALEATGALNERALLAKTAYTSYGIRSADHFRGQTLLGNASLKNLRHVLAKLPEGITELMVHPGSAITYGTDFDLDPQRQTELRMLLDETIPAQLRERKIERVSFGDL